MTSYPLISVIVPVYNCASYLGKCVESLLAQTYPNLEIVLVDDGSTDDSGKRCDEYAQKYPQVKVIHQKNGGVSAARNAGITQARGEYIGFVDSDDYVAEDMYSYLYGFIQTYQVPLAVCNYADVRGPKITPREPPLAAGAYPTEQALLKLIRQMSVCNKLFSKRLWGTLRFSSQVSYGEDLEIVFELFLRAGKIAYGPETKYYYFINPQSATHSGRWNPKHLNYLAVSNRVIAYAREHNLPALARSERNAQFFIFSICLRDCVLAQPVDEKSLEFLRHYFRRQLLPFIGSRVGWAKKAFVLSACIHYGLAARIYNAWFGQKGKK